MEKKPFYLFKRKLPSGKKIWYWYVYDKKGNRLPAKSTGCSVKNDAFNYCLKQLAKKNIYVKKVNFGVFADGWFSNDHVWVTSHSKPLKDNTLLKRVNALNTKILPYFGDYDLSDIDTESLLEFKNHLITSGLSGNYVNTIMSTLRIMLSYALDNKLITSDPFTKNIKSSVYSENKRVAFTIEEIKYLFSCKWKYKQCFVACLLGAVTGMRISEVAGLQPEQIKDGHILIDRQVYKNKIVSTKTNVKRFATIPKRLEKLLFEVQGSSMFIFTYKVIEKPIRTGFISRHLYRLYTQDMKNRKTEELLTFHAFRYFCNTYLLSHNISQFKVDFMIGHSSGKGSMTRLYTTWRPEMYSDVLELQEQLLDELGIEPVRKRT